MLGWIASRADDTDWGGGCANDGRATEDAAGYFAQHLPLPQSL